MNKQVLDVRKNSELVAETPEGLMKIRWLGDRKFEFELPGGMRFHRTVERALQDGRFCRQEEGKVVPAFQVLTPVVGADGELAGVKSPPLLKYKTA